MRVVASSRILRKLGKKGALPLAPSEVQKLHRELQKLGFKTYNKTQSKYRGVF